MEPPNSCRSHLISQNNENHLIENILLPYLNDVWSKPNNHRNEVIDNCLKKCGIYDFSQLKNSTRLLKIFLQFPFGLPTYLNHIQKLFKVSVEDLEVFYYTLQKFLKSVKPVDFKSNREIKDDLDSSNLILNELENLISELKKNFNQSITTSSTTNLFIFTANPEEKENSFNQNTPNSHSRRRVKPRSKTSFSRPQILSTQTPIPVKAKPIRASDIRLRSALEIFPILNDPFLYSLCTTLKPLWEDSFKVLWKRSIHNDDREYYDKARAAIFLVCMPKIQAFVQHAENDLNLLLVCLMFPTALPTYVAILNSNSNLLEQKRIRTLLEKFFSTLGEHIVDLKNLNPCLFRDISTIRAHISLNHKLKWKMPVEQSKIFYNLFKIFGERIEECAAQEPSLYKTFEELFVNFQGHIPFENKDNTKLHSFFVKLLTELNKEGLEEKFASIEETILQQLYDCFNPPVSENTIPYIMATVRGTPYTLAPNQLQILAKAVFQFKIQEFRFRSLDPMQEIGHIPISCFWLHREDEHFIFTPLRATFKLGFLNRITIDFNHQVNELFLSTKACTKQDDNGRIIMEFAELEKFKEKYRNVNCPYVYIINEKQPFIILETTQDGIAYDKSNKEEAPSSQVTEIKLSEQVVDPLSGIQEWLSAQTEHEQNQFCTAFKFLGKELQTHYAKKQFKNPRFRNLLANYMGWINFQNEPSEYNIIFLKLLDATKTQYKLSKEHYNKICAQLHQCFYYPLKKKLKSIEAERRRLLDLPEVVCERIQSDMRQLSPLIWELKIQEFIQRSHLKFSPLPSSTLPCFWIKQIDNGFSFKPLQLEFDQHHFLRKVKMDEQGKTTQYFQSAFGILPSVVDGEILVSSNDMETVLEKLTGMNQSETACIFLCMKGVHKEKRYNPVQNIWIRNNLKVIEQIKLWNLDEQLGKLKVQAPLNKGPEKEKELE